MKLSKKFNPAYRQAGPTGVGLSQVGVMALAPGLSSGVTTLSGIKSLPTGQAGLRDWDL